MLQDEGSGINKYNATYKFRDCKTKKLTEMDITFRTKVCYGQTDQLLTPMRIMAYEKRKMPNNCTFIMNKNSTICYELNFTLHNASLTFF